MGRFLKAAAIFTGLAVSLGGESIGAAQKSNQVAPAPVPAQILSAKKVFIANGGGDESFFDTPQYTGGPDRLYNEFYEGMKSWGRYELVSSPADADLVFEISLTVVQLKRAQPLREDVPAYDSQFRVTIRDLATQTKLWGLTEHAQPAVLQSSRDKNFEEALYRILFEVKKIAGPGQAAAKPAAGQGK